MLHCEYEEFSKLSLTHIYLVNAGALMSITVTLNKQLHYLLLRDGKSLYSTQKQAVFCLVWFFV